MTNNMRNILTIAFLLGGLHLTIAQTIERSVLGSAGESVSNSNTQLEITVGEIVTLTATNTAANHVTQGFNQPIVATGGGVSVSELALSDLQLVVYPNPATDVLNIRSEKSFTTNTSYSVLNQLGQVVKSGNLDGLNSTIDISDLASSTYLLTLKSYSGTRNQATRFIKN